MRVVVPVPSADAPEEMVYFTVEVTEKKSFRVIVMMHCRLCLFVTQEWSGVEKRENEDRRRNSGVDGRILLCFNDSHGFVNSFLGGWGQITAM